MSDAESIRNLLSDYCHLLDDGDRKFMSLFVEDGLIVEEGRELPINQLALISEHLSEMRKSQSHVLGRKHLSMNPSIRVDGDSATATSDLMVVTLVDTGAWVITGNGRYVDELVKQNEIWKFKRRVVRWYLDRPYRVGDPEHGPLFGEMLDKALTAIKKGG